MKLLWCIYLLNLIWIFFYILSKDVIYELDIFLIYNRNVDYNEICWKNDIIFVIIFVIVVMYSLVLISKYGVN